MASHRPDQCSQHRLKLKNSAEFFRPMELRNFRGLDGFFFIDDGSGAAAGATGARRYDWLNATRQLNFRWGFPSFCVGLVVDWVLASRL